MGLVAAALLAAVGTSSMPQLPAADAPVVPKKSARGKLTKRQKKGKKK